VDAAKSAVYKNFKQVPAAARLTEDVFPFGPSGYCRGPEGYESWYDNDVRCHTTVSAFHYGQFPDDRGVSQKVPASEFVGFRKRELEPAKARGLYIMPMLQLPDVMKSAGVAALPWLHDYAQTLAKAFKDEPFLGGWFIADETSDDYLWGIAATEDAMHRADPSKLVMVNHFGVGRILRFEPYLNTVMTDYYPITTNGPRPVGVRQVVPVTFGEDRQAPVDIHPSVWPVQMVCDGQFLRLSHTCGTSFDDLPGPR